MTGNQICAALKAIGRADVIQHVAFNEQSITDERERDLAAQVAQTDLPSAIDHADDSNPPPIGSANPPADDSSIPPADESLNPPAERAHPPRDVREATDATDLLKSFMMTDDELKGKQSPSARAPPAEEELAVATNVQRRSGGPKEEVLPEAKQRALLDLIETLNSTVPEPDVQVSSRQDGTPSLFLF